ncbi:MAG: transcription elongation factor GreA [Dehalococcoidales bacterium]
MTSGNHLRLGDAAEQFLAGLATGKRAAGQQELLRFVRWFGADETLDRLAPSQIGNYADNLSQADADFAGKLAVIRTFLAWARKAGLSRTNLATHLKARQTRAGGVRKKRLRDQEAVALTKQGYDDLQAELAELISKRPKIIEDTRNAAADKDFKENAPLHAAREQRGHLEGRVKELEEILASAVLIDESRPRSHVVAVGDSVVLEDVASGREMRYTIVGPNEVDAANGRISGVSPIGRAILGKTAGETVEVTAPAGTLRYRVVRVGD